ncbi:Bifunctional protein GlmU [subsurface metagenome]
MQAIILAAGESSRFWPLNYQHKVLFKTMGKPLIWYTIDGLKKAGVKDFIVVQGPQKDIEAELKNYNLGINIKYIVQPEPKGMGDAVMKAQELISEPFFVMSGHKVNAGDYIKKMKEKKEEVVLLGSKTNQPWLYGILEVEGDKVKGLIEKPEKGKEPSDIKLSSLYLLSPSFFEYHKKAPEDHYSFEKTLSSYMKEEKVGVFVAEEDSVSLKYPYHLFSIAKYLLEKNLGKKVYIGKNVKIFKGAIIQGPIVLKRSLC